MIFFLMIPCESIAEEPAREGRWGLHVAFPWVNNFLIKPDGEKTKHSAGFIGLGLGLDYYHSENSFIRYCRHENILYFR